MNGADLLYYIDAGQTRGPVPASQIAQMIQSGALSPGAQVASPGGQGWTPAANALGPLLNGFAPNVPPPQNMPPQMPPQFQQQPGYQQGPGPGYGQPVGAPQPPTFAIRIHCVSGPDYGKAYMIGASEVSLGRVSGLGQMDPAIAEHHVMLSWQNNAINFRTFQGTSLRVGNTDLTQGVLVNGQHFQMGASMWEVGTAPVELGNFLGSLSNRLNRLTSADKLEGFSLTAMFSEVFKRRKPGELEDYFVVGTVKTTPPLEEVQTGWPKPWFFMRILAFFALAYGALFWRFSIWHTPQDSAGLLFLGAFAVPLATVFLIWELNTPRNVSFPMVLALVCLGGVFSLFANRIVNDLFGDTLNWMGAMSAGICEETAKLLAVVLIVRNTRHKYILNGVLFGAAVGTGFAAFESAGYGFRQGFLDAFIYAVTHGANIGEARNFAFDNMFKILHDRAMLAPFGHMIWTAISAGALWRVKGGDPFRPKMLIDPSFLRTFIVPMTLHMTWNSPLLNNAGNLVYIKFALVALVGWYVLLTLVQQGYRQIREQQVQRASETIHQTQRILTMTSGRFGAQAS
jgi:RsiW-degrading membrane proteinase PrsW (M82 family)